ncbi:DsbA family protein [Spirosoma spitsbergense]|uniref:DsbA family protein n=1 Tax=Spirosoma spitsbergense TaxID=431554 RepID=UPI0003A2C8B4|nr:thioredoxin domain-containing protein [Spirosoma spitsbergense]
MPNQALIRNAQTVELIEYGDFSCQRCREFQKVLTAVLPLFDGEIVYTFRHFPAPTDTSALLMAMVAEAARRQERYWAMHNALLVHMLPFSMRAASTLALQLGMDTEIFLDDLHDETLKQRIWSDIGQGHSVDVAGTPTLFLGTRHLHGRLTQARLAPLIRHYIDRSAAPVVGTVDQANGRIYWSGTGRN